MDDHEKMIRELYVLCRRAIEEGRSVPALARDHRIRPSRFYYRIFRTMEEAAPELWGQAVLSRNKMGYLRENKTEVMRMLDRWIERRGPGCDPSLLL